MNEEQSSESFGSPEAVQPVRAAPIPIVGSLLQPQPQPHATDSPAPGPTSQSVIDPTAPSSPLITDVQASTWQYIRKRNGWELAVLAPLAIIYEWVVIRYGGPALLADSSSNSGAKTFTYLVLAPVLLFLGWWRRIRKKIEDQFLAQFAAANGFSYMQKGTVDETYGTIFQISKSMAVSDIINGTYRSADLRLFLCDVTVGSGRSRTTYRNTVIELDLHGQLPTMLLTSRRSKNTGIIKGAFPIDHTVSLEGDFNQYFTLYAQEGTEVEALEVFAPDLMVLFEDASPGYDVEFTSNRMYIYANGYIGTEARLESAFALAKKLIDKVGPVAGRMTHDVVLTDAAVSLSQSRTRRRGQHAVLTVVIILIVCILIINTIAEIAIQ